MSVYILGCIVAFVAVAEVLDDEFKGHTWRFILFATIMALLWPVLLGSKLGEAWKKNPPPDN